MKDGEFHSLRGLARKLGAPRALLRELAAQPYAHYDSFLIDRPGKAPRRIDNPDDDIKFVHRQIRKVLLAPLPLPDHVHGCVRRRSPLSNAETHCGQRNVASVDIKNFYPSVTHRVIYEQWRRRGFGPKPAWLLTKLTTLYGHLPQGAPTSDALANHVLAPTDGRLSDIAAALDLQLSRYLDNIDLSGLRTREAIPLVIDALRRQRFAVRHKKTFNAGPRSPHISTGLTTNNPRRPSVPRKEQRRIRSAVHELICAHRRGEDTVELAKRVRGRLVYLRRTNRGAADRLDQQLAGAGITLG